MRYSSSCILWGEPWGLPSKWGITVFMVRISHNQEWTCNLFSDKDMCSVFGMRLSTSLGAQCLPYPWLHWSLACFFFSGFYSSFCFQKPFSSKDGRSPGGNGLVHLGLLGTCTLFLWCSGSWAVGSFGWVSLCWHSSMPQATYLISPGFSVLTYTIELGKRLEFISAQIIACLDILCVKPSF